MMRTFVAATLSLGALLAVHRPAVVLVGQSVVRQPAVPVVFETELGRITIEVDAARAPISAANFLRYVDGKYYDGGVVDRAVRPDNTTRHDVEIQVIQFQLNAAREADAFPPIALERTSVTGLRHTNGTVSMARGGADTATGSFFVTIGDQKELDFGGSRNPDRQGFAAYGRVTDGMDVVRKIQSRPTLPAGAPGPFGTETLSPPIKIVRAFRK